MTANPETIIADSTATLENIFSLSAADMAQVDSCIHDSLQSDVVLINQIANYIVSSGGKRLRPMLLTLSAHACGYKGDSHIPLAAIIEFIHTATLLHDDVLDEADIRRGEQTARRVWGNHASILVGDYLYSQAMALIASFHNHDINEIMADACRKMAEGEVLQLCAKSQPDPVFQCFGSSRCVCPLRCCVCQWRWDVRHRRSQDRPCLHTVS